MDLLCFKLELNRSDGSVKGGKASISSFVNGVPSTVVDLKESVQSSFDIPKPIQKLSFEHQMLDDSASLKEMYLREGDTISVSYDHEGDCKEIIETVQWLRSLEESLGLVMFPLHPATRDFINRGIYNRVLVKLAMDFFYPWFETRTYVNKLHFIALNGFDIMAAILSKVLSASWEILEPCLHTIVEDILLSLWNMCESAEIKKMLLAHDHFLGLCLKCFTLKKVEDILINQTEPFQNYTHASVTVISNSLGILCNLSDFLESHRDISTSPGSLDQLCDICLSSRFTSFYFQLAVTTMFRLASSKDTHPLFLKILRKVLDISNIIVRSHVTSQYMLSRFFIQLIFSQLVLGSTQHIPEEVANDICMYMRFFLRKASYKELKRELTRQQYDWCGFTSIVSFLYVKSADEVIKQESPVHTTMEEMYFLSMKSIILALRVMAAREKHKQLLFKENLRDFICCAPFHVPVELKADATLLAKELGCLHPPSLLNIVRCKLAKVHFGLRPILERSVTEIITELSSQ